MHSATRTVRTNNFAGPNMVHDSDFLIIRSNTNRLTTAILWFIWQGMIFRVPTSTFQKTKQQGGWALVDTAAKCKTLLLNRMWLQSNKEGTATASWL